MILYAESSAILRWLLQGSGGDSVREELSSASEVFASRLTLIECERVLCRGTSTGRLREGQVAELASALAHAAESWRILEMAGEPLARVGRSFPVEPVRTLDAIHLASALWVRRIVSDLAVLSVDGRIRANAVALGLRLAGPAA